MKVEPLSTYAAPAYPTRERFAARPELLIECVPSGWRGRGLVAGALLALIASGCTGQKSKGNSANNSCPQKPPSVAPIFEHGEGSGAIGGEGAFGPFISEDEARQIINQELEKQGFILDKSDFKLSGLYIKQYENATGDFNEKTHLYDLEPKPIGKKALILDGYSTSLNFGYEYVSVEEYLDLGGIQENDSTIQPYEMKQVAEELQNELKDYGQINAAVFYDPVARLNDKERNSMDKLKEEDRGDAWQYSVDSKTREYLRRQVRDFIKWAKKNGVLKTCNDDNKK